MFRSFLINFFKIPKHPNLIFAEQMSISIKAGMRAGLEGEIETISKGIKKIDTQ